MKIIYKLAVFLWLACAAAFPQATLTTPTPGTQLSGSTVTFDWTCSSCGATAYWLDLGTTAGGNNIYSSGNLGNVLTLTVRSLPLNGTTVYATLYSLIGSTWQYYLCSGSPCTYTSLNATAGLATMTSATPCVTSPCVNNSTLTNTDTVFTWAADASATNYWIDAGTSKGANNIITTGELGNVMSYQSTFPIPANGTTMYLTLYSLVSGNWYGNAYTYILQPHYAALSWTAPTGSDPAASYVICRSDTYSTGPFSVCFTGITGTSYNDTSVNLSYTSYYEVAGIDSTGHQGPWSTVSAAAVICVPVNSSCP